MKKILASAVASLFLAMSVPTYAGEVVTAGTAVTSSATGTNTAVDFYTQMRQVQERLAALKAKQDTSLGNIDQIQADLNAMQADYQAKVNAVLAPFKEQFVQLYTLPSQLITPEVATSKSQIDFINSEITRLGQERDAKAKSSGALQAYLDASKKLSDFDVAKVARVAVINKQATDASTAATTKYRTEFNVLYAQRGTALAKVYELNKQLTSATASGAATQNLDALRAEIAQYQKTADDLKARMDALGVQLNKDLAAITAIKTKALVAIDTERKPLVYARAVANNTLISVTRPFNTQISSLLTKLTTVSVPYNLALQTYVKTTEAQRASISRQMEEAVMKVQSEYVAQATAYLKAKGLI